MRKDLADLWVAALRSGQYEQGQGALCRVVVNDRREYCCLGVLSQLAADRGLVSVDMYDTGRVSYGGEAAAFPFEVQEWAGIGNSNPMVRYEHEDSPDRAWSLAELNDDSKLGFDQIADIIEEQYERL